jgi:2-oxoglutarate dehydrogenase E2 component (dihydrolipoamide succinyltransferase)
VITPSAGESVTEAEVGEISVKVGDAVKADDVLLELETDKAAQEIPAPVSGTIAEIAVKTGDIVEPGNLLLKIEEGAPDQARKAPMPSARRSRTATASAVPPSVTEMPPSPSASRMMAENRRQRGSRHRQARSGSQRRCDQRHQFRPNGNCRLRKAAPASVRAPSSADDEAREDRVRMTRLRQTIARRLKDAQNTAAMLTTYNEVDMGR